MPEHRYDFDRIKAEVSVPMILARRSVALKAEGDRFRAACPIAPCKSKTGFIAWEKGWKCHSCSKKGNVIDLVCELQQLPRDGKGPVEAAKLIYDWFGMNGETKKPPASVTASREVQDTKPDAGVNEPLKFTLKDVTPDHPYLRSRGFLPEHAATLECGFFPGKGSMQGRVVFPIHNGQGELVAYAGRLIDDAAITDERPRWLFGKGFRKTLELYNLHRVNGDSVVVVESFWGVLACIRAGIPNAVCLMGHDLSERQGKALSRFGHITLLFDGDQPGREGSIKVGAQLLDLPGRRSVKVVFLPEEMNQPDMLDPEALPGLVW